ncbi:hypothetical protein IWX90DRAFT_440795 [Phyllosticta citrichinensis]|uniref:LYR motif-containing protein Cup1-like N-terminal domain-containing protein n=1 Tax=Phyllosticta citrichinensis TaxID=1130410 RepID=A0ABR1XL80_9PEZI
MPPPSRGDAVASRRLLRALLREATYLPDPAARQFVRRHVLSSFDDYRIKPTKPDSELDSLKFSPERIREKFRQARKGLSLLRRANEGELRPLERILSWTYGRHGPYRYELLRKHLLVPDNLYGQQAVEHHYATLQKGDDRVVLDNLPSAVVEIPRKNPLEAEEPRVFEISPRYPRLKGFLEATVRNSHLIVSRSAKLKKTKFSVPARNTWERPMPHKRVRNQVEEWYAIVLDKLQPPLAEEDWNRLRGLVLGQIPWEGLKPRRPRALEMQAYWSQYDVDKLVQYGFSAGDYRLDMRLRQMRLNVEGPKEEKIARLVRAAGSFVTLDDQYLGESPLHPIASDKLLRHQLEIERLPTKMPGVDRAIRFTPRSMRRLWAKIFAQCPVMWYDAQRKKWNAKWGFSTTWESDQAFKATADDLSLFEGAESFAADKKKRTSKRRSEDVEEGGKSPADD